MWINISKAYIAYHVLLPRGMWFQQYHIHNGKWSGGLLHARKTSAIAMKIICMLLEDSYCLSGISLNSLLFTIRSQFVKWKPKSTLLTTWGIFNLPHHIDMVWEELAFDDTISYTQIHVIAMTGIRTPVPRVTYLPSAVTNWANSPPEDRSQLHLQDILAPRHDVYLCLVDGVLCPDNI